MAYKICIDPGHGGIDSGAVGNGLKESQVVLPIALEVGEIVGKHGVDVLFTRKTDVFIELNERASIANNAKVNYFISIHANSADSAARGTETFAFNAGGQGEKLAAALQQSMISCGIATANRGVKFANFAVLRETNMPAALVETLFISNAGDAEILKNRKHDIAVAIAKGILNFLGIPLDSSVFNPQQPKPTVMYRVILDGVQVEALSYQDKAEAAVREAVDSGKAKTGKVQRNTDGVDLYFYPPAINYENELCRIIADGTNVIALTGKTKCINWAKANCQGHIVIQCVKNNAIVAEFDNVLDQGKSKLMYRVILDGVQVEALSYLVKAEAAVREAVDSGKAKSGKVQRNTDSADIYFYPLVKK